MIDFLVIGGGIAGVSAGARLAQMGSVLLLEAEASLGYHTSGRSAALYEENYGAPPVRALNEASRAYHKTANGGYLSPRGLLNIARDHETEQFEQEKDLFQLEDISIDTALEIVPILDPAKLARAGYSAAAQDIDTDRLQQDFTRSIRQQGGDIRTGQPVRSLQRTDTGWAVQTADTVYQTRQVVNAAGAWADQIATHAGIAPLGIIPYRRSMARIAAPGGYDLRRWPLIFGAGEAWYAKPDAGALLVSPADEDATTPHDAYASDMVLAQGLAAYQDMVTVPVTRPIANWAGLRSFAPDRSLVLGPDPLDPSFVWCAGQGGYGMQSAPGASQLLADLVAGRPPDIDADIVADLRPDRFRT